MIFQLAKHFFLFLLSIMVVAGCAPGQQFSIPEDELEHIESLDVPLHFGEQRTKHVGITVFIQEKACHLLLDTAFAGTIGLKPGVIDALALPVVGKTSYRDAEGKQSQARTCVLPTVRIGELSLSNVPAREDLFGPEEFDGHIGRAILEYFNIAIDYRKKTLTLCNSKQSPAFLQEGEWFTCPLAKSMCVKITAGHAARDYVVGLDTGSNAFAIPKTSGLAASIFETYGVTDEHTIINQRNGKTVYRYRLDDFAIGSYPLGEMEVIIADMAGYMGNGILGHDFFYNNLVYIDFQKRLLYLKPASR